MSEAQKKITRIKQLLDRLEIELKQARAILKGETA